MIRRQLTLVTAAVVALTWLGAALAQADSVIQRYDLAIENLQVATASVPQDGAQARDELERALNALLTLSRDATSASLVQAMERTFERTRVAVDNQSRTDMAVQTAVLAGGFSRLVMDSAYQAASAGDLEVARARLEHLAERGAYAQPDLDAIAAAPSGQELRLAFEAGTADAIAARLRSAGEQLATDADAAYVSLATAYGESLLVQDSPRIDPSLNRNLVAAAQAVVNKDAAALATASGAAEATLASLAGAARAGAAGSAQAAAESGAPAPEILPPVAEQAAQPAAEPAAEEQAASAPEEQAAPAETAPVAEPAAPEAVPGATVPEATLEEAVAARLAELDAEATALRLTDLTQELVRSGLPRQAAATAAERLLDQGHDGLAGIFTGLEAAAGRVAGNVARGDQAAASAALAQLSATYTQSVAPLLGQLDDSLSASSADLFAALGERDRLTQADADLLSARVALVRGAFSGERATLADDVEASVGKVWSGLTSNVVYLILGVLAIFPLVLLNMAFGGSNRNWRLVGWALFLLLVPVFYQALTGLVEIVRGLVALDWLPDLARWSMFNSLAGQVVWVLLVLVALILATLGLRGICMQFGLLGGGKKDQAAKSTAVAAKGSTGHTTIDWDEEF